MEVRMIPGNRVSTHPGVILLKEFLEPMSLTQKSLAGHVGIPVQRVNEIVRGKRGITPETAWLFSAAFSTTPEFWLNLQALYDLSANRPAHHVEPLAVMGA
jgi:addiction module HigA family antidote